MAVVLHRSLSTALLLLCLLVSSALAHKSAERARVRTKRNPIAVAVINGVIGMTTNVLTTMLDYKPVISSGGCRWYGKSPGCFGKCPVNYNFVRKHDGSCEGFGFSFTGCPPDGSFGMRCAPGGFYKHFCCKQDRTDCSWAGRWVSSSDNVDTVCRYENVANCGKLICRGSGYSELEEFIEGQTCDEVTWRTNGLVLKGKAGCGIINWYDGQGRGVNEWYKSAEEGPED